ncbi:MAG: hypothetical protein C5S49_02090 [Candidatus Methanogaster sp.]|nr:MAG: hypothetical protein C5S49_02090 [ANME-2 cluster archaeon]
MLYLEKILPIWQCSGTMVGAAADQAHRDQLVLSTMVDILADRYRVMQVYSELTMYTSLVSGTSIKT